MRSSLWMVLCLVGCAPSAEDVESGEPEIGTATLAGFTGDYKLVEGTNCSGEISVRAVDPRNVEVRFSDPGKPSDDTDPRRFSNLKDDGKQGDEYRSKEGASTWRCRATLSKDGSGLSRQCRGASFVGELVVDSTFVKLGDRRLRNTVTGGASGIPIPPAVCTYEPKAAKSS
jgi:hypothetical protein